MGRQIQVAATPVDEEMFLSFLRRRSDFVLLEGFAETIPALWKERFEPQWTGHFQYYIWNKAFQWTPEYKQVVQGPRVGWYYVANKGDAPLIEFLRTNLEKQRFGRIYWAEYFSAHRGLSYDVEEFSSWYDSIVHWVKRNARGKVKKGFVVWFLPHAWEIYSKGES